MAGAAIIHNTPRYPVSEFEGENRREGKANVSGDERARQVETESRARNNGHRVPQDPNPSSSNELKREVTEVVDQLGPMSDDDAKRIQDWLELGS